MNSKRLLLPIIVIILTITASVVFVCFSGVVRKPLLTEAEFLFSVTYKYNSETVVAEGIYVCEYSGAEASGFDGVRYWSGGIKDTEGALQEHMVVFESEEGTLFICPNIDAGYVMGEPSDDEHYSEEENCQPYIMYSCADGTEYTNSRITSGLGLEILSWDYPQPIENRLEFSHFTALSGDSVIPLVLVAVIGLVSCLFFVHRETEFKFEGFDLVSVVLNFFTGVVIIPFITAVAVFAGMNGDSTHILYQIIYCIPAFSVLCLAFSVCLRRKGYNKSSVVVQFIGPLCFAAAMIIECLVFSY